MGWKVKRRERYALIEVDEVNPRLHRGNFSIGPVHVKHHATKEFIEHAYVENPDFASEQNCRVFAQSSNIAVEVYDFYNKLFDPDYENVSVYDERFEVQYLFRENPERWRSADYYNPRISVIPLEDGVDIKKVFDTDYGAETLEITYTVRTGARLKHTIVFTNKTAEQRTFRVVMRLAGITSDRVKHRQGEEQIIAEKHTISPFMVFGGDNQHLKFSEYLWSLGETDEEALEWSPNTLKDIVLDVHAQGSKVDIVIGNYILAENESLLIDPDSDTWQVGADSDDCDRRVEPDRFGLNEDRIFGGSFSAAVYGFGGGYRFTAVDIPQHSTIDSAYFKVVSDADNAGAACNTRVSGHDVDNSLTFSTKVDFDDRYNNHRTAAVVDWDAIPAWSQDEYGADTFSPDIKTVIREIVNRGGWSSGNALSLFWEDLDDRSDNVALRRGYAHDQDPTKAARLEVTWTPPVSLGGSVVPKIMMLLAEVGN